jgi:DNA sulfur modification protein DndE
MTEDYSISRIEKVRFKPTREAEEFLEQLRRSVVPGEKYRVARLAFARSLQEGSDPAMVEKGTETGTAIEGTHLFGQNSAEWACAFVAAADRAFADIDEFRSVVEAHWHRGATLLKRDFLDVSENPSEFAQLLATKLALPISVAGINAHAGAVEGERARKPSSGVSVRLAIKVGEVGIEKDKNVPAIVEMNAPGISPHFAVMGKTRSGKSRTGLEMAQRIAEAARTPLLLIDPKGEFVKDGAFVRKDEWGGKTIADRFPGAEPLDVPIAPIPLDFLALDSRASSVARAQAAIAFRDSFRKCIKAKGDVAMDDLRQAVEQLLTEGSGPISLDCIRDAVRESNERAGKKRKDGIEAKLNELTSLNLFTPSQAPSDFFRRRWVVGLGSASEESRRLVVFLLLNALSSYLLSMEDAATDSSGYRAIRHLLVVDEAREILSYKHDALSNLVRKSAAKGGIVGLLSQSPEDFEKEEDDFLSQMGVIAVFTSSARSIKNLRAALGRRCEPDDFSDKQLPPGMALVKLPKREPVRVIAWK